MKKTTKLGWILVLALATVGAWAQQPSSDTSTQKPPDATQPASGAAQPGWTPAQPAGESSSKDARTDQPMQPIDAAASQDKGDAGEGKQWVPDTTPLNSPMELTLGADKGASGRSYIVPNFKFSQSVISNSGIPGQGTEGVSNLSAGAQLVHSWARSALNMQYTAGGTLYTDHSYLNSAYQQWSVGLNFDRQHWTFGLQDTGSYMPQSNFGFFGTQFGGIGGGLGSGYLPNQSVLTDATRISNTVVAQTAYRLSARSSLHFSGQYGVLRFQSGGYQNDDDYTFVGGYDRSIGASTTVGLAYQASLLRFAGLLSSDTDTHSISPSYGRRIAGRVALQLAGGPEIRIIDTPLAGEVTDVSWQARGSLAYQLKQFNLMTSVTHSTRGGSGVVNGATESTQWDFTASRSFARQWQASANVGVAYNKTLQGTLLGNRNFNSQYVGAQVTRIIGREFSVYAQYSFQHQTSNFPVCIGCSDTTDRHVFGMGFQWQGRPITGIF